MNDKQNKNSIIAEISQETGLAKKDVKNVVNLFINKITHSLLLNEKVLIKGFGTFFVKEAKPRRVNDFRQEGERLEVGSRYLPKFRFSEPFIKEIKEKVK